MRLTQDRLDVDGVDDEATSVVLNHHQLKHILLLILAPEHVQLLESFLELFQVLVESLTAVNIDHEEVLGVEFIDHVSE